MPWEIYLDFLADQDFDELRNIPIESFICGVDGSFPYHIGTIRWGVGNGETQNGCGRPGHGNLFDWGDGERLYVPSEGCGKL